MDFVHDQRATREPVRVLTVIDCYTRECVALVARMTFRGEDVAAVLSTVAQARALPPVIQCDQGTEFTSLALDHWVYWNKVQLAFSRPATPGTTPGVKRSTARCGESAYRKATLKIWTRSSGCSILGGTSTTPCGPTAV